MGNDNTVFTLLSAKQAQGAGTGVPMASSYGAQISVYSAAGSSCTVLIQGSHDNTTWKTLVSLTDPAAAPDGSVYQGTAMPYMRANVSAYVSGSISATCIALDHDPGNWQSITVGSNTAGDLTCSAVSCTTVTSSALTATRVPYAGANGLLTDEAAFTYTAGTNTLGADVFAGTHKGGVQDLIAAKLTDGAIASAPGTIVITKASPLGSSTLATPTTTTHDGYVLRIVSSTAQAHVVSCASGKVNGGSITTLTFGAAIGNSVTLVAYQGVWYTTGNIGVTLS